jgi:hypothetical protein
LTAGRRREVYSKLAVNEVVMNAGRRRGYCTNQGLKEDQAVALLLLLLDPRVGEGALPAS